MAGVASPPDEQNLQGNSDWTAPEDQQHDTNGNGQPSANGDSSGIAGDDSLPGQDPENPEYPPRHPSSVGDSMSVSGNNSKGDRSHRGEKQVKPNKVYIGGLPEHTRQEDLQNCFGKIGKILNIELKVGYGFVEFENKEAAEESVQKYHEGFFMGQKIRVELSHGGGRTAKYSGDPGACFRCGQVGHWARECPSTSGSATGSSSRRSEGALIDRIQRDYTPRNPPPRDDYPPRYPPRDPRYEYPPVAPPPRDYRRPPSPGPRDYRDYPAPPPRGREYDDYRRGPPPPVHDRERYPPPPPDYGRGRYAPPPPPPDAYRGYPAGPPPIPGPYDRYDRRPAERYPPAGYPPPPPPGRGRTPPPRDYDRPPTTRDYPDYRGRPASPPRYPPGDFPRVSAEPPAGRYRRRSLSPGPTRSPASYDAYNGNGYSGNVQGPPRRDYPGNLPPPPRSGRDMEPAPYRRP
ncbi:hypothetical protein BKA70DRAFT_1555419 [Coprinopsis sp. MPI-PUGE-AT-0042]|nr:hypothetical protein BKA70DRAFT_1555419 [Coprinopsis sp. MPI-PUGE-AT-0042]